MSRTVAHIYRNHNYEPSPRYRNRQSFHAWRSVPMWAAEDRELEVRSVRHVLRYSRAAMEEAEEEGRRPRPRYLRKGYPAWRVFQVACGRWHYMKVFIREDRGHNRMVDRVGNRKAAVDYNTHGNIEHDWWWYEQHAHHHHALWED